MICRSNVGPCAFDWRIADRFGFFVDYQGRIMGSLVGCCVYGFIIREGFLNFIKSYYSVRKIYHDFSWRLGLFPSTIHR